MLLGSILRLRRAHHRSTKLAVLQLQVERSIGRLLSESHHHTPAGAIIILPIMMDEGFDLSLRFDAALYSDWLRRLTRIVSALQDIDPASL